MDFPKKAFTDSLAVILSERPLFAMQFEQQIAALIPALDTSIDSFEDSPSAYAHCSNIMKVGLFFLHQLEISNLPINCIDELATTFESVGSTANLFIVAENEKSFAE